jgi:hypothetical protein
MAITSDEATVRHTRAAGDDLMRKIIKREEAAQSQIRRVRRMSSGGGLDKSQVSVRALLVERILHILRIELDTFHGREKLKSLRPATAIYAGELVRCVFKNFPSGERRKLWPQQHAFDDSGRKTRALMAGSQNGPGCASSEPKRL